MATENDPGTLEDERQITRLLTLYCELLDTGQVDRIATEVYTAEAVADYNFDVLNGRLAINDYLVVNMAGFRETAHALSNVSLKACDGRLAEVTSMLTAWHWFKRPDSEDSQTLSDFAQIVVCTDRLMCTPEGWRITEHRARALGPSVALTSGSVALNRDENR
jgi:hypothetical protein